MIVLRARPAPARSSSAGPAAGSIPGDRRGPEALRWGAAVPARRRAPRPSGGAPATWPGDHFVAAGGWAGLVYRRLEADAGPMRRRFSAAGAAGGA